ncbi:MAG: ribosome maturation factor RimM [Prevotellaceae bacterium]|nr:ribosome maturation factor RimM [Prevotellaceae bacterium]
MIKEDEVYKIGRIGKPHGISGEVTLRFSDDVFDRVDADYLVLMVDGILVPFFIEEYRFRSDEVALVKFEDIDTMDRASELTGCDVFFPRHLADAGDDVLTWSQIVGYDIVDVLSDKTIGRIEAVDETTINTLLELSDGTLIPAADEFIEDIDHEERKLMMRLPEGLVNS